MAETETPVLDKNQRLALHVLGYLFLRMGQFKRAQKTFSTLLAVDASDKKARRCLAVAYLNLDKPEKALEHLEKTLGSGPLSSRESVLYLLKARALWKAGRQDEARNAVNTYLSAGGARS